MCHQTTKVCQSRATLFFKVATTNRNALFDPTNLGNTPTNDLANDFAMIGLVPSRHCKIRLSITQLCGVQPLQLLNSDQCAPHSLRRKEPKHRGKTPSWSRHAKAASDASRWTFPAHKVICATPQSSRLITTTMFFEITGKTSPNASTTPLRKRRAPQAACSQDCPAVTRQNSSVNIMVKENEVPQATSAGSVHTSENSVLSGR